MKDTPPPRPRSALPFTLAPGDLLTAPAVAALLGCHARTVRRLIEAGKLPALRLGSGRTSFRIHADDLMAFVQEHGHHDPAKVAASHPDILAPFAPRSVTLVTYQRPDGFLLVEPYRPPAGLDD